MLSKESQSVFFVQVFGESWTNKYITPLKGMNITVAFTTITFGGAGAYPDTVLSLPCTTNALMKGTADPAVANQAKNIIIDGVLGIYHKHGISLGTYEKPIKDELKEVLVKPLIVTHDKNGNMTVATVGSVGSYAGGGGGSSIGGGTLVASGGAGGGSWGAGINEYVTKVIPESTPKNGVVRLRDATKIGQKVEGTAPGSIYRVIALNTRVKLAARISNKNQLSIRAEYTEDILNYEVQSLKKMGMVKGGKGSSSSSKEYYSLHIMLGDCPFGKVIGALLLDTEIKFDSQIKNYKEMIL